MLRKVNQIVKGRRTVSFILVTRLLLSILISIILLAFSIGILKVFLDLFFAFNQSIEVFIRKIIVDSVILLALIEVLRIATSYLRDGRVRIRYIVDTVLIVLLNETISLWFKGNLNVFTLGMLITLLLALMFLRILAIKFSPNKSEEGFE